MNREIPVADWPKGHNRLGVWTLFRREFNRFFKISSYSIAAPVITTLLYLVVFVLAVDDPNMVAGIDFGAFLVPGLVMMTIAQNAFENTSSNMVEDKMERTIEDILMPPLTALEILIALTASGVLRGLFVGTAVFVVAALLVPTGIHDWRLVLVFATVSACLFSLFGLIVGLWAEKWDQMEMARSFIVIPLTFLSATFFSLERLPAFGQTLLAYNPVFYLMDGFRAGVIGHAEGSLLVGIIINLSLTALFALLAYRLLQTGYKLKS